MAEKVSPLSARIKKGNLLYVVSGTFLSLLVVVFLGTAILGPENSLLSRVAGGIAGRWIYGKNSDRKDGYGYPHFISPSEYNVPLSPLTDEDNFTVVILTHDRDNFLWLAMEIYANVSAIDRIIVYWNNPGRPPPDFNAEIQFKPDLLVIPINLTSLNERFFPLPDIRTKGVFIVDDDLLIPAGKLLHAFDVWKTHPWGIVGFTGRDYTRLRNGTFRYKPSVNPDMSMVLTNAAFVHKEYLRMYTYSMDSRISDLVTELFNCEDIAMNFLIAYFCQCESAYLVSSAGMVNLGIKKGIWTRPGHTYKRHQCVDTFAKVYGRMPLHKKVTKRL